MNSKWLFLIKIIVSVLLLCLLFSYLDLSKMILAAGNADIKFLLPGLFIGFLYAPAFVYRWKGILKMDNVNEKVNKLWQYNCVGLFVSSFLPGSFGGDLVRPGFLIYQYPQKKLFLFCSVILERFSGFISVSLLLISSGIILAFYRQDWHFFFMAIIIFAVAVLTIFLILQTRNLPARSSQLPLWLNKVSCAVVNTARLFSNNKRIIIKSVLWSMLAQLFMLTMYWMILLSVDVNINFILVMTAVSWSWLVALVPLSLNGLGLREGSIVYLLSYFGINSPQIGAAVLLALIPVFIFVLIGAIVFSHNVHQILKFKKIGK